MRTARLLSVSPSMHRSGGVPGSWGVYLVTGVYLVLGGVPAPRGCTWSGGVPGPGGGGVYLVLIGGVYLVPGGYLVLGWGGGGVPGLGGLPGPGGVSGPRGCACPGIPPVRVPTFFIPSNSLIFP